MKKLNKNRIRFYFLVLVLSLFYLTWYVDSVRYHNFLKNKYSLASAVELIEFKDVAQFIRPDNAMGGNIKIINNTPVLTMRGFDTLALEESNKAILKQKILHPSQNLALFSMGYASAFFNENLINNKLDKESFRILKDVYLFVFQEIKNPLSFNSITVNDHVVSERIQFLSLFIPFVKEFYPKEKKLLRALQKDFNICLGFLLNDRFFTWQTNHGIMQLRSLAQIAGLIKSREIREKCLYVFDERLSDIIPYFIGEDGAVYESASGYWFYIYSQFKKISEIESVQKLKSVSKLKIRLEKIQKFIYTVASNDGFVQGMGNSYSFFLDLNQRPFIPESRIFHYSNELGGVNWKSDSINVNILFISLFTPPNIHKLPEDLCVFIYLSNPLFSNTGTYSYNQSKERMFIKSNERAHSTVYFKNASFKESDSSRIYFSPREDDLINFTGEKHYKNGSSIIRNLSINNGQLQVIDYSNQGDTIISQFNLAPTVTLKRLTENTVNLITHDSLIILIESSSKIEISESIISPKPQKLSHTNQIKITGDSIKTIFKLPIHQPSENSFVRIETNESSLVRETIANSLEKKYFNKKNINFREKIINRIILIIILWGIFIVFFEILIYLI